MLSRILQVMSCMLVILAYIDLYFIKIIASIFAFICSIAIIPTNLLFGARMFTSDVLHNLTIPISKEDYEYRLDNPIPFKGLEGKEVQLIIFGRLMP